MAEIKQLERLVINFEMNLEAISDGIKGAIENAIERGDLSEEAAERFANDAVAALENLVDVRASENG